MSFEDTVLVHELCENFEELWRANEAEPSIADHLKLQQAQSLAPDSRQDLLHYLIETDISYRQAQGQLVTPALYADLGHDSKEIASELIASQDSDETNSNDVTSMTWHTIPDHIGLYEIQKKNSFRGGFGCVYQGVKTDTKRRVAIKFPADSTPSHIERFDRERRINEQLTSDFIPKLLESGQTEQGRPFFILEFVDGEPITKFCSQRKFSISDRIRLVIQVCNAVHELHKNRVIHRDLKPLNILVEVRESGPRVQVIDFGLAKLSSEEAGHERQGSRLTEEKTILGSRHYMSPEQAQLDDRILTTISDIYSLGVVLFELITGSPPIFSHEVDHPATLNLDFLNRVAHEPVPSLEKAIKLLPDNDLSTIAAERATTVNMLFRTCRSDLNSIVQKATAKAPDDRYGSAVEFMSDLKRFLAGEPVAAHPTTLNYRLSKYAHKNWRGLIFWSSLAVFLIAAVIYSSMGWKAARENSAQLFLEKKESEQLAKRESTQRRKATENALAAETARNEAVRARDEAKESLNILIRAFEVANPANGMKSRESWHILLAARKYVSESTLSNEARAYFLGNLTNCLSSVGESEAAIENAREDVELRTFIWGPEDERTLASMHNLASELSTTGQLEESIEIFQRVIDSRQILLGPEEKETLNSLHGLALAMSRNGRMAEAFDLESKIYKVRLKKFGPGDLGTISSANNLAVELRRLKRFAEAEDLIRSALANATKELGPEHPETLTAIANLALILESLDRHEEAAQRYEEAIRLRTKILGPFHPQTLLTRQNYAVAKLKLGELTSASRELNIILSEMRTHLGNLHPTTLVAINGAGSANLQVGNFADAIPLLEESIVARESVYGEAESKTLLARKNLIFAYERAGLPRKGLALAKEQHRILVESQGPTHTDTLESRTAIASFCVELGKFEDAIPILEEEYHRAQQKSQNPIQLLSVASRLANAYQSIGNFDLALPLLKRNMDSIIRIKGKDHPASLILTNNYATGLSDAGEFEKAMPIFDEVYHSMVKALGKNHPNSLTTILNYATCYSKSANPEKARKLLHEGFTMAADSLGRDQLLTLRFELEIGKCELEMFQYEAAVNTLASATSRLKDKLGEKHPLVFSAQDNLANGLFAIGQVSQAIHLYRQTLNTQIEATGPLQSASLKTKAHLAEALTYNGKAEEACKLLKDCISATDPTSSKAARLNHLNFLTLLGEALAKNGLADEAAVQFTKVLEDKNSNKNTVTVRAAIGRAKCHIASQQPTLAVAILEQHGKSAQSLVAKPWLTIEYHATLGEAYLADERFDKSRSILSEAWANYSRHASSLPHTFSKLGIRVLNSLVDVSSKLDDELMTRKWRKQLTEFENEMLD